MNIIIVKLLLIGIFQCSVILQICCSIYLFATYRKLKVYFFNGKVNRENDIKKKNDQKILIIKVLSFLSFFSQVKREEEREEKNLGVMREVRKKNFLDIYNELRNSMFFSFICNVL